MAAARYTLLLNDEANESIDYLQKALGLRSRAAVFDTGTALLKWYVDEYSKGYRLGKSDGTRFQELFVPVNEKVVTRQLVADPLGDVVAATGDLQPASP